MQKKAFVIKSHAPVAADVANSEHFGTLIVLAQTLGAASKVEGNAEGVGMHHAEKHKHVGGVEGVSCLKYDCKTQQ